MHFIFHTLSLGATGGSRVIINLSNYLSERGHKVSIVIDNKRIAFPLSKKVRVYHLKDTSIKEVTPRHSEDTSEFQKHIAKKKIKKKRIKLREKYAFLRKLYQWKRYSLKLLTFPTRYLAIQRFLKEQPVDLAISHNMYYFLEHYFFYPKDKLSVVLHNSPDDIFLNRGVQSLFPLSLYFKGVRCLPVSKAALSEMKRIVPSISEESRAIYNPFDFKEIRERASGELPEKYQNKKYIISVASLDKRKRIERAIYAFSELEDKSLELLILGVGGEEAYLRSIVVELGIQEKVHFLGFVPNPMPYIKNAQALVLTSDSEGLPTVLIEALICDTMIVSTNCQTGPSEILTGNLKPFLIDIEGRSEASIIGDITDALNQFLSKGCCIDESALRKFSKEVVVSEYISLASENKYS